MSCRSGRCIKPLIAVAAVAAATAAFAQDSGHGGGHHQHAAPNGAAASYARSGASYQPPAVVLIDSQGTEVDLAVALDHDGPLLLQFIFTTCPAVCPVLSATFQAAQSQLGDDLETVRMVSISIDPEHDTPERLREYARRFRAGQQWLFLTGGRDDVVAVQKSFDVYRGNKMRHEPVTFLRPAAGDAWLRFEGFLSAADLVAEVRPLLNSSTSSAIPPPR